MKFCAVHSTKLEYAHHILTMENREFGPPPIDYNASRPGALKPAVFLLAKGHVYQVFCVVFTEKSRALTEQLLRDAQFRAKSYLL